MSAATIPETTLPTRQVAALLGMTTRRVRQLAGDGIIPRAARGRFRLIAAVQGYCRYLISLGGEPGGELDADRRRLLRAKADLAEMEADRMRGTAIPTDEVDEAWQPLAVVARQRLLGVPTKAAPVVASEADPAACHRIIAALIKDALSELPDQEMAPRLAIGGRANGGPASSRRANR